jgi:hypothetical protein
MLWTQEHEAMACAVHICALAVQARAHQQVPEQFALMVCLTRLLFDQQCAINTCKNDVLLPLTERSLELVCSHQLVAGGDGGNATSSEWRVTGALFRQNQDAARFHLCSVALTLLHTLCAKDDDAVDRIAKTGAGVVAVALMHVSLLLRTAPPGSESIHGADIEKHTRVLVARFRDPARCMLGGAALTPVLFGLYNTHAGWLVGWLVWVV